MLDKFNHKPPHTKDGRKQLCYRCGRYCGRTKNTCPTCDKRFKQWDATIAKLEAEQRIVRASMKPLEKHVSTRHFVGAVGGKHGVFVVWSDSQIFDREAYRDIAREAKEIGLETPYFVYGKVCTYSGPGIEFRQISAD